MEQCSSPRQCYVALTQEHDERGFWPSLVTENQPGYQPLSGKGRCAQPWYWGTTLDECQQTCGRMNQEDFGLSVKQALEIRLSSLRASGGLR
jgi:hypothetical protein